MTSAAILRAAAAKMRERAEAATQGEWSNRRGPGEHVVAAAPVGPALVATTETREDRRHIASWHPAVALAVADLLDNEANAMDRADGFAADHPDLRTQPYNHARRDLLVTVANAYLGTP